MIIDWSKAPEWAHAHGNVHCITTRSIWFNDKVYMYVGDNRSYPWGVSKEGYNHCRENVTEVVPRPVSWSVSGLPPAGTVCEFALTPIHWVECTIHGASTFQGDTFITVVFMGAICATTPDRLRPIRTTEQIAAEEIQRIRDEIGYQRPQLGPCPVEQMYLRGYRKAEITDDQP